MYNGFMHGEISTVLKDMVSNTHFEYLVWQLRCNCNKRFDTASKYIVLSDFSLHENVYMFRIGLFLLFWWNFQANRCQALGWFQDYNIGHN